ncbi:MAG: hypothetical protein Kow00128_20670 [Deltaproteobacteria bacterium]
MRILRTISRRAVLLGALLLLSCGGSGPRPEAGASADAEWIRAMKAGRSAFSRGDLDPAVRFFETALSRGRAMDDPAAIVDAAYNLAAVRMARGEYPAARRLLRDAEAESARTGGPPGDLLLLLARTAWRMDDPGEALRLTDRLIGSSGTSGGNLVRQALLLRGRIACERGDGERARAELAKADETGGGPDPATQAFRSGLSGCILRLSGDAAVAASEFDREAERFREAGLYRNMGDALSRAGAAWSGAVRPSEAADRWFRAARAFFALGDLPRANDLAKRSLAAATRAKNPSLAERNRALMNELAEAASPGAPTPGIDSR